MAGADTTHNALMWGLYFMMAHPEIQTKVQKELDEVTLRTRAPGLADRKDTPYTEAVIQEILRKSSLFPISLHASLEGGYLDGGKYFVPPKTTVCLNYASVANDPKNFVEPEQFNPKRFLDPEGCFSPDRNVISFGLGKRRCPGNKH